MRNLIIIFLLGVIGFMYVNRGSDANYKESIDAIKNKTSEVIGNLTDAEKREEVIGEVKSNLDQVKQNWYQEKGFEPLSPTVATAAEKSSSLPSSAGVQWKKDLPSALKEAEASNKLVLVDFYTTWCGFCKKMDKDTFSDASIAQMMNENFVSAKIDGDVYQDLVQKYGVRGYPTILVLDSTGGELFKQPGYMPPEQFKKFLENFTN